MKPVAPKERLLLPLSVVDPKPRAPKSTEILEGVRRVVNKSLLDPRHIRSSDDRLGFVLVEHAQESGPQMAWLRNIFVLEPYGSKARLEESLVSFWMSFLDVDQTTLGLKGHPKRAC